MFYFFPRRVFKTNNIYNSALFVIVVVMLSSLPISKLTPIFIPVTFSHHHNKNEKKKKKTKTKTKGVDNDKEYRGKSTTNVATHPCHLVSFLLQWRNRLGKDLKLFDQSSFASFDLFTIRLHVTSFLVTPN